MLGSSASSAGPWRNVTQSKKRLQFRHVPTSAQICTVSWMVVRLQDPNAMTLTGLVGPGAKKNTSIYSNVKNVIIPVQDFGKARVKKTVTNHVFPPPCSLYRVFQFRAVGTGWAWWCTHRTLGIVTSRSVSPQRSSKVPRTPTLFLENSAKRRSRLVFLQMHMFVFSLSSLYLLFSVGEIEITG